MKFYILVIGVLFSQIGLAENLGSGGPSGKGSLVAVSDRSTIRSFLEIFCSDFFGEKFYKKSAPSGNELLMRMAGEKKLLKMFKPDCLETKNIAEAEQLVEKEFQICLDSCKAAQTPNAKGSNAVTCDQSLCEERCRGEKQGAQTGMKYFGKGFDAGG